MCSSRYNANPEGETHVMAFPLGLVNAFGLGTRCSIQTGLRPNQTKLLTDFIKANHPTFNYSTIQFNRGYSAKLHVDGNNEGPSYIIGLGDYTGGELWIMDENGDHEAIVQNKMLGWKNLEVGTRIKGRLINI